MQTMNGAAPPLCGQGEEAGRRLSLRAPVLSLLMRRRGVAGVVFGAVALQAVLVGLGVAAWQCPFRAATGLPCPGCGLSRAAVLLLKGEWAASWALHPFAAVFLLGAVLVGAGFLLPERASWRLANAVEKIERRTGVTVILLTAAGGFGLVRLIWFALAGA